MKTNRLVGGTLIIAGTCIGAGMLALPVSTATTGFYFSLLVFCCAWFFMYLTGLYVLEVNLSLPAGNNYVSMTQETLGKQVAFATWLLFIGLLYSLLAAYVTSGGALANRILDALLDIHSPSWLGPIVWTIGFSLLIYIGIQWSDYFNRLFMLGLVVAYGFVTLLGVGHINLDYLQGGEPITLFAAFPVIFTSFGYHIVVPSMGEYMENAPRARQVILYGSLLPLLVYMLWELIIFGSIPPTGENSLAMILQSGQVEKTLYQVLATVYGSSWTQLAISAFVFFAIASSFLGVSLGLFDFIADSAHLAKERQSRWVIILLTFLPPVLYAEFFPHGFIMALNYAGIFVAVLHGILPVCLVYARRQQIRADYQVCGGNGLLLLTLVFFVSIIALDIMALFTVR